MGRGYYQDPDGNYYQTEGDGKDVAPAPAPEPAPEPDKKD